MHRNYLKLHLDFNPRNVKHFINSCLKFRSNYSETYGLSFVTNALLLRFRKAISKIIDASRYSIHDEVFDVRYFGGVALFKICNLDTFYHA